MNLFLLNINALKSAIDHCDKHCVKMILETTQLLYSAWHVNQPGSIEISDVIDRCPHPPYKCTHKNHPSAVWVREQPQHYEWALRLGNALCSEYDRRYGKTHKCQAHLDRLSILGFPKPRASFVDPRKQDLPANKTATVGIPQGCKYFYCAINDEIFDKCAVYDKHGRLHGVKTYRNYYKTKNTDKWTLKWNKSANNAPRWFSQNNNSTQLEVGDIVVKISGKHQGRRAIVTHIVQKNGIDKVRAKWVNFTKGPYLQRASNFVLLEETLDTHIHIRGQSQNRGRNQSRE
jgi:hypothetical protein